MGNVSHSPLPKIHKTINSHQTLNTRNIPSIRLTPFFHLQILFLLGLPLILGPQKTIIFFARRQKLKGTATFTLGIILILFRWTFVGFLVELYGIGVLFGDFLGTLAGFVGNVPVVGPYLEAAMRRLGVRRSNSELPV